MALDAGALAYLVKTVQPDELVDTIRKAAAGQRHVPPDLAARLASGARRAHLSPRELEVLKLMIAGKRNREIAAQLAITEGTVKIHVSNVLAQVERHRSHRSRHPGASARHRRPHDLSLRQREIALATTRVTRIRRKTYPVRRIDRSP